MREMSRESPFPPDTKACKRIEVLSAFKLVKQSDFTAL
jgi:hypothetical protein